MATLQWKVPEIMNFLKYKIWKNNKEYERTWKKRNNTKEHEIKEIIQKNMK